MIIKNSEEEKFITELMSTLENIDITDISSKESFENIAQEYIRILNTTWYKFSKNVNITKYSKVLYFKTQS